MCVSETVWPDGSIIFSNLAIYNSENLPRSIKICQIGFSILPNTKLRERENEVTDKEIEILRDRESEYVCNKLRET